VCVCVCVRHKQTHRQTKRDRETDSRSILGETQSYFKLQSYSTLLTCKIGNLIIRTIAAKLIVYE